MTATIFRVCGPDSDGRDRICRLAATAWSDNLSTSPVGPDADHSPVVTVSVDSILRRMSWVYDRYAGNCAREALPSDLGRAMPGHAVHVADVAGQCGLRLTENGRLADNFGADVEPSLLAHPSHIRRAEWLARYDCVRAFVNPLVHDFVRQFQGAVIILATSWPRPGNPWICLHDGRTHACLPGATVLGVAGVDPAVAAKDLIGRCERQIQAA